jgi:hypothetical protein
LADCIQRLLTDEHLYAELSKEALAAGLEWDWNIRARAIWSAIEKRLASLHA